MIAKKNQERSQKSLSHSVSGNTFLEKVKKDKHFRLLITTALGSSWNLIYAVAHLVLAIINGSFWFLTMGVYYLTIFVIRTSALKLSRGDLKKNTEGKALKINAVLFLFLAVVFSGVICLAIRDEKNMVCGMIIALTMAAFTFYFVINAVINLIRLKKNRTVQMVLFRNTAFVSALGSLFGLERMMLVTFGDPSAEYILTMEAATGAGIFLVIVLLGVNLLIMSKKKTNQ